MHSLGLRWVLEGQVHQAGEAAVHVHVDDNAV